MNLKEMFNDALASYARVNNELNERSKFEQQLMCIIEKQQDEIKMLREEIQNIISNQVISDMYAKSLMEKCLNTKTEAKVQLV